MAFRVPAEFQDMARAANIRKWVKGKSFPRDEFYGTIDCFRDQCEKLNPGGTHQTFLVQMLAVAIDAENCLVTHVLGVGIEIADNLKWLKICTAAAWIVLQDYENAVLKGDWK